MSWSDEQFAEWVSEATSQVEARLRTTIAAGNEFVNKAASYLVDAGGKRLRPVVVLTVGGLGLESDQADLDALIRAAIVVELTHVATLYHDDVMDEAELRRGTPTAHQRWGNSVAIMLGDYLLARASSVGATLGEDFMVYHAQAVSRLVQGQISELRGPKPGSDPLAHYLKVIANKTASLFAACARYGAMFAHLTPVQIEALTQFGEHFGTAFQLADDLLDITSERSGKPVGTDLLQGVPTLVSLLVKSQNRPEDTRLLSLLSAPVPPNDLEEALCLLRSHPAITQAQSQIHQAATQALYHLNSFPDQPATRSLTTLCTQL